MAYPSLLITGATGFIGSRLAGLALERGHRVHTLTRSMWSGPPDVPVSSRWLAELPERIPPAAFEGVKAVVHCAVSLSESYRHAHAVNVEGSLRLAELARDQAVETFIFLSSQSAKADAISIYGRTKYEAELRLRELSGLNVIVLRPGLVTGIGKRGLYHRMARIVERLPVIPLLGGGHSIVQPIHVDDLCAGILRCAVAAEEYRGARLCLGDPEGVSLARFLQAVAEARLGRRRLMLPIPLGPIEAIVRAAEGLGIPLPIRSNNLRGLRTVERMETAEDLERLGLAPRALAEVVAAGRPSLETRLPREERPVRILLIGAGKIGLLHALTMARLHGVVLCGLVDPKPAAIAMLLGMGLEVPAFRSLDEALERASPDAAVIATPTTTHVALAQRCLEAGLAVLIEKPLAIRRDQLTEYRNLARSHPEVPIQVGYLATRYPHVSAAVAQLRSGRYGRPEGFFGATLLSLIQSADTDRWEVRKEISGGGAYINSGSHVLSMICQAFGAPDSLDCQTSRIVSRDVEDSLVVSFRFPRLSGVHYCSWSIDGFPRQENRLVVYTDRGHLILTNNMSVFVGDDGGLEIHHQLDDAVGFNLAADYAGAGVTVELTDLMKAARTGTSPPMSLTQAAELESLLFDIYDAAREVDVFEVDTRGSSAVSAGAEPSAVTGEVRLLLDLRGVETVHARRILADGVAGEHWHGYQLFPRQVRGLEGRGLDSSELRVTVPDFMTQSRWLAAGRYGEVLREMGLSGMISGSLRALRLLLRERGATFWVAVMAMLGAALRSLPRDFDGTLLLHSYPTDFALALDRLDILEWMLQTCRRMRPQAKIGFHTKLVSETRNAVQLMEAEVDAISLLASPSAVELEDGVRALRNGSSRVLELTAEVGPAPAAVHRAALASPAGWSLGMDALLLGLSAEPLLLEKHRRDLERRWRKVFPGLDLPEALL